MRNLPIYLIFSLAASTAIFVSAAPGEDCPKAEDVLEGVSLKCGDEEIVGTVPRADVPLCSEDGETGCIATAEFPAVATADLEAADFAVGTTLAGVEGTYEYELDGDLVVVCNFDGQQTCRVKDDLMAFDTRGAEEKILAGFFAGGVSGVAVS